MLSLDDLSFLTSGRGEALLNRLRGEDLSDANTLALITRLRKDYPADQVRAALELAQVRAKAVEKFGGDAQRMFFTREALEQASDPLVRRYERQPEGITGSVWDVCCGIGSDSLAFAAHGHSVTGIDLDAVRAAMARLNAQALGVTATFDHGDAREVHVSGTDGLVFFDPARRDNDGRRIYDVESYQPPLSLIDQWESVPVWVKLSPGVHLDPLRGRYGGDVTFVSVNGNLKEALLRRLPICDAPGSLTIRARLLTGAGTYVWVPETSQPDSRLSEPRAWLIEPDPALIRAGLVADAALAWDAYQLDETIAYVTADHLPDTVWARSWRVIDWMPFHIKKLRDYLRERGVGTVTVKKRGTAVTPEILIDQLKLKPKPDGDSRTIVLTRCQGEQIAIICEDYRPIPL